MQGTSFKRKNGFTLVELLVVIVVIAILAAVAIVSYSGITQQARQASVSSSLLMVSKKIQLYAVDNADRYPETLSAVGIANTTSTQYRYSFNNDSSPRTYCVTVINSTMISNIDQTGRLQSGSCAGHDGVYATNLIPNPSIEVNTDGWSVVSGSAALERSADQADTGSYSLKVTPTTASEWIIAGPWVEVEPKVNYAVRLKVRSSAYTGSTPGGSNVGVQYRINGGSGGDGCCTYSLSGVSLVTSTSWNGGLRGLWNSNLLGFEEEDYTYMKKLEARVSWGYNYSGGQQKVPVYFDSAMIVKSDTVPTGQYFDGNSAGWIWNGTQGLSTSTGKLP